MGGAIRNDFGVLLVQTGARLSRKAGFRLVSAALLQTEIYNFRLYFPQAVLTCVGFQASCFILCGLGVRMYIRRFLKTPIAYHRLLNTRLIGAD